MRDPDSGQTARLVTEHDTCPLETNVVPTLMQCRPFLGTTWNDYLDLVLLAHELLYDQIVTVELGDVPAEPCIHQVAYALEQTRSVWLGNAQCGCVG